MNTHHVDVALAKLATDQQAMVSLAQLRLLGLGDQAISSRVATGRLHRIHPTVYTVGHRRLTHRGRWMAAVLACGADAVLSHLSAAMLWGLTAWVPHAISVIAQRQVRLKGISAHRCSIAADERLNIDGIPVTGLSRTLFDCAGFLPPHRLEKLLQEAEFRRITDVLSLDDMVRRYPGHRGVARARLVLEQGRFGASITKEELELRFLKFLDDCNLPTPSLNSLLAAGGRSYEADCSWPSSMLVVELDSRAAHLTTHAFEADRSRDRALGVAGWTVIRVTWRQLHDQPAKLAADLRALLAPERMAGGPSVHPLTK